MGNRSIQRLINARVIELLYQTTEYELYFNNVKSLFKSVNPVPVLAMLSSCHSPGDIYASVGLAFVVCPALPLAICSDNVPQIWQLQGSLY